MVNPVPYSFSGRIDLTTDKRALVLKDVNYDDSHIQCVSFVVIDFKPILSKILETKVFVQPVVSFTVTGERISFFNVINVPCAEKHRSIKTL